MSKEDLIPMNMRSKEEHLMLSAKGGRSKSEAKSFASSLRELKKKGLTDVTAQRLVELVEDPQSSLIELRKFIDGIDESQLSFSQKIQLGGLMVSWHKAAHGERLRTENFNVNMGQEEFQRRIEDWEKSFWPEEGQGGKHNE